ncbi:WSC domain protein [Talaromyces marneffei ATCC 18224]|uniref:WSC domain protein, putative n=1 Tax=Talaromyces marneffei (strain ATCC 18224 / CBS 334.59 / QM 7333) TaxID=441960 RepID=B6QES7_TALMQ|nr:uncharacterized protein EYB26_004075 [Talaromyces marneffei]EEA24014.1 WSC domain protein, putative [Talaromyces marneffei ATCC 18224]KAE8553477.1 hypothetical protein EYB25_004859 [Talaromyces marneffei]QGA16408.1 hypothetical protein EYB26_004075 [Talaromyces marneffei]
MIFAASNALFAASSLLLLAPAPVNAITYNASHHVDCYSSLPSNFVDNGTWTYQSSGYCQQRCVPMGYSVMAMTNGNDCWCGNELPANSTKTDSCTESCDGWQNDACGGKNAYDVYLTGLTPNVPIADSAGGTTTSSATTSTTGGVTVITQAGQTIVVTASSNPSASTKSSGGTSTAGIAAGVVVGVIALAAIIGAAVFFLRRRQKQRVEAEYRRNAEISAFTQKKPTSISSDARWDSDFMAQRRQSNGSIADAGDFSRRILQVTNPDR